MLDIRIIIIIIIMIMNYKELVSSLLITSACLNMKYKLNSDHFESGVHHR